ncbi:crotonase/enoyl-CoA hydratase family protein [Euzebya tangerina]|uniref:crotonase/enoyl-CoA hydratase family protein n=1 Tax=Euzebya tangerina TaxID=591198 RepID=UPI000E311D72|nr:crotonase/enoyl-CoA hydratase family protein [Euzebya tangerina]
MYETIKTSVEDGIFFLTLNRPEALNTIVPPMPDEFRHAIEAATRDDDVKVIVVRGNGRSFCAGYNFDGGFHHWDDWIATDGTWDPGKEFTWSTNELTAPTQQFFSMWRSSKPVIAQIHGWCVGGGSDNALSADIVIASDDAIIGTPYSRMWGAYLSAMWIYRLGLAEAKWRALTGEPFTGAEAAEAGLINESVPFDRLEDRVMEVATMLKSIPVSQLQAMKLVVNHAYEQQGLNAVQTLGPILDGMMRNTPDALAWVEKVQEEGVREGIIQRDGPFGDYSQAPTDRKPDPAHAFSY